MLSLYQDRLSRPFPDYAMRKQTKSILDEPLQPTRRHLRLSAAAYTADGAAVFQSQINYYVGVPGQPPI